jgi:hypothetical protein
MSIKPMPQAAVLFLLAALCLGAPPLLPATVNDSLSFALQAADPHVKEGFSVREDYWGGDLGVKDQKAIAQQLFRGLEYWFWMGTELESAKISVHIYDQEGNLAEVESFQKKHIAAARIIPKRSGTYYVVVQIEASLEERTPWALAYGYR